MSGLPLSDEQCRAAILAYEQAGRNITHAAEAIGLNRRTFKSRLNVALSRFPKGGGFTAPTLPDGDEDIETLIARQEAEQERRKAARAAAEWMQFQVHGDAPFALAMVGDPHVDTCDIGLLRRHLDLIEKTDRMWAVGLGDWMNNWVGKLRGQYAYQSTTERDAYRLVQWVLQKPIWFAIILGNHNGQRWHGDGNPLKWMQTAVPVPPQEWQIKFEVACGGATWRIWAAHNFPGNSQFNANHGPDKRAIFTGAIADLFVAGDRHVFKLSQDQHEHTGRIYWSARAKGYKPLDNYAEELGHGGQQSIGHSIGAVFDPKTGKLQCFADLFEAAEYLAHLRSRKP